MFLAFGNLHKTFITLLVFATDSKGVALMWASKKHAREIFSAILKCNLRKCERFTK